MILRHLERHEIERLWEIDRSEIIHNKYVVRNGHLFLVPHYFEVKGWYPGTQEDDTPKFYECFDRGGTVAGVFVGEQIVGGMILDSIRLGYDRDQRQLKWLYVSSGYRELGIGTRLFDHALKTAHAHHAKSLYISASPGENTVNFYLNRGCVLTTPDPDLYALEPDDIHLVCR